MKTDTKFNTYVRNLICNFSDRFALCEKCHKKRRVNFYSYHVEIWYNPINRVRVDVPLGELCKTCAKEEARG